MLHLFKLVRRPQTRNFKILLSKGLLSIDKVAWEPRSISICLPTCLISASSDPNIHRGHRQGQAPFPSSLRSAFPGPPSPLQRLAGSGSTHSLQGKILQEKIQSFGLGRLHRNIIQSLCPNKPPQGSGGIVLDKPFLSLPTSSDGHCQQNMPTQSNRTEFLWKRNQ